MNDTNNPAGPNILVVLVDQMRRQATGHMGDPNVRTPTLDHMASRGLTFTAACSSYPVCVPFRFTLMTGEYAHSRDVPSLGYRMSPAERTLGEAIATAGYDTAYIGKWHLYGNFGVAALQSQAQSNRTRVPPNHRRGFDHWRGFELSNAFYDTWYFADDEREPRRLDGYQTDGLFGLCAEYLDGRRAGSRPFFAILSVEPPHPPFVAPPANDRRVRERGDLHLPANVSRTDARRLSPGWRNAQNAGGPPR